MTAKGKMCHYTLEQILKIEPTYEFDEDNIEELCDMLEMDMMRQGFVLYDDVPFVFREEVFINRYHEIRYSSAVFIGRRRHNKFLLKEACIQYKHIK